MHPQCVITGAEFFSPIEGRYVHGDLHKAGRAFIFFAVTNLNFQPVYEYGKPAPGRLVIACLDGAYFERRGVIVFDEQAAQMNDEALRYVRPEFRPAGQELPAPRAARASALDDLTRTSEALGAYKR